MPDIPKNNRKSGIIIGLSTNQPFNLQAKQEIKKFKKIPKQSKKETKCPL